MQREGRGLIFWSIYFILKASKALRGGYSMTVKAKNIRIIAEPMEFFRERVSESIQNQNISANKEIEFYLVMVLARYMEVEKLIEAQRDPLAIKLHKAACSDKETRIQLLKELGDFALYISGFFADSLSRKIIDIDYYIKMGGSAYANLSCSFSQKGLQSLYGDLAVHFTKYVDVFAEISDEAFSHSSKDLLRLYEKWLKTKSDRLALILQKEGLFPTESPSTEPM
jgi:hypothetical protein